MSPDVLTVALSNEGPWIPPRSILNEGEINGEVVEDITNPNHRQILTEDTFSDVMSLLS